MNNGTPDAGGSGTPDADPRRRRSRAAGRGRGLPAPVRGHPPRRGRGGHLLLVLHDPGVAGGRDQGVEVPDLARQPPHDHVLHARPAGRRRHRGQGLRLRRQRAQRADLDLLDPDRGPGPADARRRRDGGRRQPARVPPAPLHQRERLRRSTPTPRSTATSSPVGDLVPAGPAVHHLQHPDRHPGRRRPAGQRRGLVHGAGRHQVLHPVDPLAPALGPHLGRGRHRPRSSTAPTGSTRRSTCGTGPATTRSAAS